MKLFITGFTRREAMLSKTEAQFLRDYLNSLTYKTTTRAKMCLASNLNRKLDLLTYTPAGKKE